MSYFSSTHVLQAETLKLKAIWQALYPFMRIHVLRANGTITEGQCVASDVASIATAAGSTTGISTSAQAAAVALVARRVLATGTAAAGEMAFVGVALHDAVAGEDILVCTGGLCPKVLFSGATDVTAGDKLVAATTAGSCIKYASATHTATGPFGFAVSTETDTAGFVAAIIHPTLP